MIAALLKLLPSTYAGRKLPPPILGWGANGNVPPPYAASV